MYKVTASFCSLLILLIMISCGESTSQNKDNNNKPPLLEGRWRAILSLDQSDLPFNFDLNWNSKTGKPKIEIINATERILLENIQILNDSIIMKFPIYNSEIRGQFNDRRIVGNWFNYAKGPDYSIPFYAKWGDSSRFHKRVVENVPQIDGRWEIMFMSKDKKSKVEGFAELQQDGQNVTGTILTPTGDYRYLEGWVAGPELKLSCFDGAHAFLFEAQIDQWDDLEGDFYSGTHWEEHWWASLNDSLPFPNHEKMTSLKKGKSKIEFSFPNIENKRISLSDEKYQNKVVIVQVLGTWCPNCRDESELYAELYTKYKSKGLEIIGLCFENENSLEEAKPRLSNYKKHFGINYELLYAGKASKKVASEKLSSLTEIKAFPTSIIIDKSGKIRKIHTGFNGPATSLYKPYVENLDSFLNELFKEQVEG